MPEFSATVHKVTMDKDGESTVVFKVPQSDLVEALSTAVLTDQVLKIKVEKGIQHQPPPTIVE